jgi:peptide/nickel transport system permease protein
MSLPADPLLIAEDTSLIQAPGESAPADQDVIVRGRRQLVLRRLRRNKAAMASLVVLALLWIVAFVGSRRPCAGCRSRC